MKKSLTYLYILFSSLAFSQENIATGNFSKSYFGLTNHFSDSEISLFSISSFDSYHHFENDYSFLEPKIKLEKPETFYIQDNFSKKYIQYSISGSDFKAVQSYSNVYEFQSICSLDYTDTKTTLFDLGGHVLNSYISQIKFKLKKGCK